MTKMLDRARHPDPCGSRCPHVVARPVIDVPGYAGVRRGMRDATRDPASNSSDASLVEMNEIGFLKAIGHYRERVDVEIGKASERGVRWWSRRLVELYEYAGLVRLDK